MSLTLSGCQNLLGGIGNQSNSSPEIEKEDKVALVSQKILDVKQSKVQAALENKWHWSNVVLIGGDLFTTLYLIFQATISFKSSLLAIPALAMTGLVCGCLAGVINTGVGLVSGVEAFQELLNGHYGKALRLALDCICFTGIGVIMILASLAIKVAALGAVGAFFTLHPWLLPVLFFAASIPLLIELTYGIGNNALSQDLGSQLKLDKLENLLQEKTPNWDQIGFLYAINNPFNLKEAEDWDEEKQIDLLSKKMEELTGDMGVEAGVEVFKLAILIQEKKQAEALAQIKIAKQKIEEWDKSLYLRMFQQVLYLMGFALSMGALSPHVAKLLNGIQSSFLSLANFIPLYMDTFWPFKRNTPISVPFVEAKELEVS